MIDTIDYRLAVPLRSEATSFFPRGGTGADRDFILPRFPNLAPPTSSAPVREPEQIILASL